jgi:hypothetical protein
MNLSPPTEIARESLSKAQERAKKADIEDFRAKALLAISMIAASRGSSFVEIKTCSKKESATAMYMSSGLKTLRAGSSSLLSKGFEFGIIPPVH